MKWRRGSGSLGLWPLVEARLSVVVGALAGIKALRKIQAAAVLRR